MMTPPRIALTLLAAALLFGCSDDDNTFTPDLAGADGGLADGGRDSRPAVDQWLWDSGWHPDLAVQSLPALGKLTLVVNLGDSIAAAYGIPKGAGYIDLLYDNDDATYPAYKGKDLLSKYPGLILSNPSKPGSESPALPGQAAKAPANTSGDSLVIISIGGNDLMFNFMSLIDANEARKIATKVQGYVKKVKAHFADKTKYPNKTTMLLYNVYEFTDGAGTMPESAPVNKNCGILKILGPIAGKKAMENMGAYNKEMMKFTKAEGILLGDIAAAFLGHGYNHADKTSVHYNAADPTLWFQDDCIHPNKAGHVGIRAEAWRVLFGK